MRTVLFFFALTVLPIAVPQEKAPVEEPKAPVVGKLAPGFRLNDHTGALVEVGGESERWTVLAFYPKAMTPG